ncbi:DoxX family protein [Actinomadura algeriensis]|uniref:Membrane protein n=1 Tax=Actinomadura algeriensis TaxID=1679523 RepID=A0ABR9K135_9ACTN|nr:DoxX family protein [Actinomadura algeriensis]MBE1536309.1 putative membrane protein [Actinomadura algeriensis]
MTATRIPAATTAAATTAAATTAAASGDAAGRRRTARRVLWGAQIVIAMFLLFASGLPKLVGQADAVEAFARLGWNDFMRYFVGAVEIAGAIGLVVPRLAGLAATGLIGLMIGAALTQILVIEPAWALFPAALGLVFAAVAWDRRAQTRALLASPGTLLRR